MADIGREPWIAESQNRRIRRPQPGEEGSQRITVAANVLDKDVEFDAS